MAWMLLFLYRPRLRAHLLTTRKRAVVLPDGNRAPSGGGPAGRPLLPSMNRSADATGGLCIGQSCANALGAWGPSATNKLRRVYTGALLAITITPHKKELIGGC